MHGHVIALLNEGVDHIFYPCMSYNFDENLGDNHYNCPVVAYYPEVISANMPELEHATFIKDYVGIHRRKDFPGKMTEILGQYFERDFPSRGKDRPPTPPMTPIPAIWKTCAIRVR